MDKFNFTSFLRKGQYCFTLLLMVSYLQAKPSPFNLSDSLTIDIQYDLMFSCVVMPGGGFMLTATAEVSGGTPPYAYLWWDGSTDSLTHTGPVTSFIPPFELVTITDATGCMIKGVINVITTPSGLEVVTNTNDVLCSNDSTGSIEIGINGGQPPYTIVWSDPNLPPQTNLDSLPSGVYMATVTDAVNCSVTVSTVIQEPLPIEISSRIEPEVDGNSNGSIDLTITGGELPYTYEWYRNGSLLPNTEEDLANLSAGEYQLVITDANGCRWESDIFIVDRLVNISSLENDFELSVWPQPAREYLHVHWNHQSLTAIRPHYAIYNTWGQLLMQGQPDQVSTTNYRIPIRSLPGGMYYLEWRIGKHQLSRKIILY